MDKETLENEKLKLEIKKLSQPWYTNLEFWKVFIPTLAIIVSLYYTVGRGLIDQEKKELEIKKANLRLEIEKSEKESNELRTQIKSAKSKINQLSISREALLIQIEQLSDSNKLSAREIANIRKKVDEEKEKANIELSKARAKIEWLESKLSFTNYFYPETKNSGRYTLTDILGTEGEK